MVLKRGSPGHRGECRDGRHSRCSGIGCDGRCRCRCRCHRGERREPRRVSFGCCWSHSVHRGEKLGPPGPCLFLVSDSSSPSKLSPHGETGRGLPPPVLPVLASKTDHLSSVVKPELSPAANERRGGQPGNPDRDHSSGLGRVNVGDPEVRTVGVGCVVEDPRCRKAETTSLLVEDRKNASRIPVMYSARTFPRSDRRR